MRTLPSYLPISPLVSTAITHNTFIFHLVYNDISLGGFSNNLSMAALIRRLAGLSKDSIISAYIRGLSH